MGTTGSKHPRPRRSRCALVAALIACATAPAQPTGQPPGARPTGSGRVVRTFDFEEAAFNPEVVPRYWVRAQHNPPDRDRPGFPPFNRAAFDHTVAHSATTSVRLPTAGGSTSLRLGGTVIPVFADADYLLAAMVKTEGLEHARALITARLLSQSGEPVPGSEFRSPAVLSPDGWMPISVTIPGRFESAAFMQIELLVLQPESPPGPAAALSVPKQDIAGAAWFDDIYVYQLPRVTLSPRDERPVVFSPDTPTFTGVIRDLTGEALTVRLVLRDMHGTVLADELKQIGAGGETFEWAPHIDKLGWYEATMDVLAQGQAISRSRTALVYASPAQLVPSSRPSTPATFRPATLPLEVSIDTLDPNLAGEAGELLLASGAGSVTVPIDAVLDSGEDVMQRTKMLGALVDHLLDVDAAVSLWIPRVPRDLAHALQISPDQPLALSQADPKIWGGAMQPMLDRYSQRINRWHIGPVELADEPPDTADRARRLAEFKRWLAKMVPGPAVGSQWRADWPALPEGSGEFDSQTLTIPASFPTWSVVEVARQAVERRQSAPGEPGELTVLLELLDENLFGPAAAVEELLQRSVLVWSAMSLGEQTTLSAGAPPRVKIAIAQPWTMDPAGRPALVPTAALAAFKTLSERLCGRRVLGQLSTPAGTHAFILAPVREPGDAAISSKPMGALVVWSDGNGPAGGTPPHLRTYLGTAQVTQIDGMGNQRALKPADSAGLYDLELSSMPAFIEGVDPELCLFVTGVKVEPNFVPAIAALHEHELVITNPWPMRVSGTVQLIPDRQATTRRAWDFSPTSPISFSIAPGGSQRLPFEFTFPASEETGPRTITAAFTITATQSYSSLRAQIPITIGSKNLDLSVIAQVGPQPSGPDATVTVTVTNTGRSPRTLQVDVQAPGLAQQRQPISNLLPGESSLRRFSFAGQAGALSGKRVRVTLTDVDGAERLNRSAVVP